MKDSTKLLIVMVAIIVAGIYLVGCTARIQITEKLDQGPEIVQDTREDIAGIVKTELAMVYFDFDRHNLKPKARKKLQANVYEISKQSHIEIVIEGHCDKRGTLEYNIALGQKRADVVKGYYISLGIRPGRVQTLSYGEERPFSNFHWQNRRAVTRIK